MDKFIDVLTEQYRELFANNPKYSYSASKSTPENSHKK
jgi:hypothetical protein